MGLILQRVQFVRSQNMLHWLSSSELLLDVGNSKIWAEVASVSLHCRIYCFLHLQAAMMQNQLTVLALELIVIHAMKLLTIEQKPGEQVKSFLFIIITIKKIR